MVATCAHCGRTHARQRADTAAVYCGQACRQAAFRRRRKAELAHLRRLAADLG